MHLTNEGTKQHRHGRRQSSVRRFHVSELTFIVEINFDGRYLMKLSKKKI